MKFTCNQQVLSKALNTVSKAVSSRTTIPILKGILIKADTDNSLTLSATDLDLSIEKKIDVSVETAGSTVVSAKLFFDIIRKLPHGEVEIQELENNNIVIKCLASEFVIVGQSAEEFPNIGEVDMGNQISIDKEIFKDMIKKTSFSASIDEGKGVITGVLIEMTNDSLNMIALDGFRMAVTKEQIKSEEERNIIISARILNEINKIISETDDNEDINLVLDDKKAVCLLDSTKVVLRLMDGDFIKYKSIIPQEYKTRIKIVKAELMSSIDRASILSKEGSNNLIKINIAENMMVITSRSEEGNVREEVPIDKEGEDLEIGFNSKYISDALKAIDHEEVSLELSNSVSPCLIKPLEGDEFLYLILPVRISANY